MSRRAGGPISFLSHSAISCLAICLSIVAGDLLRASPPDATLRGIVRDERGEAMPGVIVTLSCGVGDPSAQPRVVTDVQGVFAFRGLDPSASCTLRAEIPGYATIVAGPIPLKSGKTQQHDLKLISSEETTETVVVEAKGAVVDTENPAGSTTLNEEYIAALPVVGRRFQDLLTLAPGVTDADGDGNVNVHGSRDTGLQVRLDGADITDPFSGHVGMGLNLDAIQEVEVITSGAPAEYSRADGGFANVVTKSGGNELSGSLRLFFRTRWLDGDPGQGSSDVFVGASQRTVDFTDLKVAATLGGPIVKNKAWYFASLQRFDVQTPVNLGGAGSYVTSNEGYEGLVKLTWQVASDHKLQIQTGFDPTERTGLGLGPAVLPESDYGVRAGGLATLLRWTAIVSPGSMMETVLSHFDEGRDFSPASDRFHAVPVSLRLERVGNSVESYVLYPCNVRNCDRTLGATNLYQEDAETSLTSGPFYYDDADHRVRNSLKSDFTITKDGALGSHTVKAGFEFKDESYTNDATTNPTLLSSLRPLHGGGRQGSQDRTAVSGSQTLTVYDPLHQTYDATGGGMDSYVQDVWKPRPNLSVSAGARFDWEESSSFGKEPFAPRAEAREALHRFDMACDLAGILCTSGRVPGRPAGPLPPAVPIPEGHPLQKFDLNEDGIFQTGVDQEGMAIWGLYTRPEDRMAENFSIRNINFIPRFGVSWDPLNDGKTRLSGTWGRYTDRLFLGIVAGEQYPDSTTYVFAPTGDSEPWIDPGDRSVQTSKRSISVVSRDLSTPYMQEWSLSVEREIAPEWSLRLAAVGRREFDQLQDVDINHILCSDYDEVYGVDPRRVCGQGEDLRMDLFGGASYGQPGGSGKTLSRREAGPVQITSYPNGVVDLYNVNPRFNQILKIGNYNSSRYRSFELVVSRRLHQNWQMQASYTRSRARGDAETFYSVLGDDPAYTDKTPGYLDYDQRHVVKVFATTHLKKGIALGTVIQWASGTPFSTVARLQDLDDVGNVSNRLAFPTGQRNDHRNGGAMTLSGRLEKSFRMGGASAEAFLSAENLLDSQDLTLHQVNVATKGPSLASYDRRFGRRFELGASIHF